MKRNWLWIWVGIAGMSGCDHLVYVSETDLGVSVTAATQGNPKVVMGYDREEFAVVPRVETGDAMSLVAVSNIDAAGLDELVFNHYIVTGKAADEATRDPEGLRKMRREVMSQDK